MKRFLRYVEKTLDLIMFLVFFGLILYGGYAVWDSWQVEKEAESCAYEEYRPLEGTDSFEDLQRLNPDVFGWLTIYDTYIDYPLVQAADNFKYVNTNVKGEFALTGSLFLDYRNKRDFSDLNSIIYGHHMEKKTMFGELSSFQEEAYFESHRYGALFYEGRWHTLEFFAFLQADAYDSGIYSVRDQKDTEKFLNNVQKKSIYYRTLDFGSEEHFVTLSTCMSSGRTNGRHVLIGCITDRPVTQTEEKIRGQET